MSCCCSPVGQVPTTIAAGTAAGAATQATVAAPVQTTAATQQVAPTQGVVAAPAQTTAVVAADTPADDEADRYEAAALAGGKRKFTPQSVHMVQFRNSTYNPDGPSSSGNCAVVATVMALRLAGHEIPGFTGQRSNEVITKARVIGTGANNFHDGTNIDELKKIVTAAGGTYETSQNIETSMKWAREGAPVVLSGNSSRAWGKDFDRAQVSKFDGGHSVTLTYDKDINSYVVNDSLSKIGPLAVTETEVRAYASAPGYGLGMRVL